MKMAKRLSAVLAALLVLLSVDAALGADDGFSTSYTYNYDYWSDVRESPDAYRVATVINSAALGLEKIMRNPQSLYARDKDLYIADTGNNRILQVRREGQRFVFVREIASVQGAEPATFNSPQDVYADPEGNIYVADTNNQRVIMMDRDLNYLTSYVKPQDSTFDQGANFLPNKIVVDVAGRVYVLVTNVNKGLAKFEANGVFTGFIGANKVTTSMADYIWKRYFQTEAQRAQSENFVPTEYCNVYMDEDGFIYAVTNVFKEYDLLYDNAKPIRRLNGIGNDILIKNDRYPPIGDLVWDDTDGPSKFVDITVLEGDIYVAFDRTRGRIFGYDPQGIMLWAFGTRGNTDGAFKMPSSIEHMGYDLLCLDSSESSITVFTPTEYGNLIYQAAREYSEGRYDDSADTWREVLRLNSNYNLAFIGVGRALLRQEHFEEAMNNFEMAHDRENYGRAFKLYRKIWVEKNLWWVALIILAIVLVPVCIGLVKKMKWEVIAHEHNQVRKGG